ncbi:hypothetical protein HLB23_39090 [Nocardia uniformis]|uniref:Uncharacterized protein n=1 Tax=Nocardia uniformis TaxID=53432 RepID=A0A849CAC7_9NOCA|nr:hypothetical protein [Nocardia uniformis]NNH75793.1 hypothetical protein [Nocardia uniformis]
MNTSTVSPKTLHWPLILGLGTLALIRPLSRIIENRANADLSPQLPIAMTLGITVVWIAAVAYARVRQPVLTLICAGLTYGVLAIVLSAIGSLVMSGRLEGPLATPIAIAPVLLVNAIWGLFAGVIALVIARARG